MSTLFSANRRFESVEQQARRYAAEARARPFLRESVLTLTEAEAAQLSALRAEVPTGLSLEDELIEVELLAHTLPGRIRKALIGFRRSGNRDGVLLLRGMPMLGSLPETPLEPSAATPSDVGGTRFLMLASAALLGEPVAYQQEQDGALFRDVYPTRENAEKLSSESSLTILDSHTELAFHHHMPDFVGLMGLKSDHDGLAATTVTSVHDVVAKLNPRERLVLSQPRFRTDIDYSFGSTSGKSGGGPEVAVLSGDWANPQFRYDLDLMTGTDAEASAVLARVKRVVDVSWRAVFLQPGDLVWIDNRRTCHARTPFLPRFDGTDRWLRRLLVLRSLQGAVSDVIPGQQVICSDFSTYLAS
jgi:L-asparagine oxygenase